MQDLSLWKMDTWGLVKYSVNFYKEGISDIFCSQSRIVILPRCAVRTVEDGKYLQPEFLYFLSISNTKGKS